MTGNVSGCDAVYHVPIKQEHNGLEIAVSYGTSSTGRWNATIRLCELQIKGIIINFVSGLRTFAHYMPIFTLALRIGTSASQQVCTCNSWNVFSQSYCTCLFCVFSHLSLLGVTQISQQALLALVMDPQQVCNLVKYAWSMGSILMYVRT